MAKVYCGLAEERSDTNGRAQLQKLLEYHSNKKSSISCSVCDYLLSCLDWSLEYNHNYSKSNIRVV